MRITFHAGRSGPSRWRRVLLSLVAATAGLHGAQPAATTNEPADAAHAGEQKWLDDGALAVRLASFLWNASPDDELRALARRRELHRSDILRTQTVRLLQNPRSRRCVDALLESWLGLRGTGAAAVQTQSHVAKLIRENAAVHVLLAPGCTPLHALLVTRYGERAVQDMRRHPERLARHLVQELFARAAIPGLQNTDTSAIADILARTRQDGYPLASLIQEVVQSEPFQSK